MKRQPWTRQDSRKNPQIKTRRRRRKKKKKKKNEEEDPLAQFDTSLVEHKYISALMAIPPATRRRKMCEPMRIL